MSLFGREKIVNAEESYSYLKDHFELTVEEIQDVVKSAVIDGLQKADASIVAQAKGWQIYDRLVNLLSLMLTEKNWRVQNISNLMVYFNDEKHLLIIISKGNELVGNPNASPMSTSKKGKKTLSVINEEVLPIFGHLSDKELTYKAWVLLHHVNENNVIQTELSQPNKNFDISKKQYITFDGDTQIRVMLPDMPIEVIPEQAISHSQDYGIDVNEINLRK